MILSPKHKIILHDLCAVILAWVLALLARFNFELPPREFLDANLAALPVVVVLQAAIARYFRLYRGLWRFASLPDLLNIIRAAALGALAIGVALFVVNRLEGIPRSVLVLYPLLLVFLLGGPRLAYRLWKDHTLSLNTLAAGERVLVIGAGQAGETMVRDILRARTHVPVGLIDDRKALLKARIHGVPVLGSVDELVALAARYAIDSLIIAVPSASGDEMRRIVQQCEQTGLPFRTLPRLADIASGRVGLETVREVAIDDLLGRDKVELDWRSIQRALVGRVVLVTGGGGSIGAELCRQLAQLGPSQLVVFDQSEFNLYSAERQLRAAFPQLTATFVLGDVCDTAAVARVFRTYRPSHVFHAAAYKHVPLLEEQVREAVRNNVLGTAAVIAAAEAHGCDRFVLISSDKAVRASSVMGATKRFSELLCVGRDRNSRTSFITVRFGNVLGSAGSVVPLFTEQIRCGGPVTVTHPQATRYFMTIPEACQLIMQAGAVGRGGEIFVLDMGKPINIGYLAETMIRLSGKIPGRDIEIEYTGLRPGEKLHEELFLASENLAPTPHQKLLLALHPVADGDLVGRLVDELATASERFDEAAIRNILARAIPGFGRDGDSTAGADNVIALQRPARQPK